MLTPEKAGAERRELPSTGLVVSARCFATLLAGPLEGPTAAVVQRDPSRRLELLAERQHRARVFGSVGQDYARVLVDTNHVLAVGALPRPIHRGDYAPRASRGQRRKLRALLGSFP